MFSCEHEVLLSYLLSRLLDGRGIMVVENEVSL